MRRPRLVRDGVEPMFDHMKKIVPAVVLLVVAAVAITSVAGS